MTCCIGGCKNEATKGGVCCDEHKYNYSKVQREHRGKITVKEMQERIKQWKSRQ